MESNGEFTFGSGSSMTFSSSGIGIWGENGAVINDNGGTVISLDSGATVIRSRIANGIQYSWSCNYSRKQYHRICSIWGNK